MLCSASSGDYFKLIVNERLVNNLKNKIINLKAKAKNKTCFLSILSPRGKRHCECHGNNATSCPSCVSVVWVTDIGDQYLFVSVNCLQQCISFAGDDYHP